MLSKKTFTEKLLKLLKKREKDPLRFDEQGIIIAAAGGRRIAEIYGGPNIVWDLIDAIEGSEKMRQSMFFAVEYYCRRHRTEPAVLGLRSGFAWIEHEERNQ